MEAINQFLQMLNPMESLDLFLKTLNQMGFLLFLMVAGFILAKAKAIPENGTQVLSKLENNVFIPALVLGTFMGKLTPDNLGAYGEAFLCGAVVVVITLPVAVLLGMCFSKNGYLRKIYTYGLAFSNFGFMGNAVVQTIFPDLFDKYLVFVLPFWAGIYLWGVPFLPIPSDGKKRSLWAWIKPFLNPMFIGMLIGVILGLTGAAKVMPPFLADPDKSVIKALGDCMSPVAMLLTGMTSAKIDLKKAFTNIPVYLASITRLVLIPVVAIFAVYALHLERDLASCVVCCLAMPLGLSPVVVPAGYGKDTSDAAGMALISHLLSCATIPVMFALFDMLLK